MLFDEQLAAVVFTTGVSTKQLQDWLAPSISI